MKKIYIILSFKEWSQINPTKTMSIFYRESKYIY